MTAVSTLVFVQAGVCRRVENVAIVARDGYLSLILFTKNVLTINEVAISFDHKVAKRATGSIEPWARHVNFRIF